MSVIAVLVCGVASVAALLRWLRVAQREHYIAGSCLKFAWRWTRVSAAGCALAVGAASATAVSFGAGVIGSELVAGSAAVVAGAVVMVFPWRMRLLGEPRLRFTRRAQRLTAISLATAALVVAAGAQVVGLASSAALVCALVPAVVDTAAACASRLERWLLKKFRVKAQARLAAVSPVVIAVTGSWGKTSTKEHIRDLLSGDRAVVASPASFNNEAGLSRTINEHLVDGTEVLIVEMGMYKPGEIRSLCSWIKPDIAVITAIGPMHLEHAGSLERIVAAKAEILERAEAAVLWVDDPRLDALAADLAASRESLPVWRVGSTGTPRLDVEVQACSASQPARAGDGGRGDESELEAVQAGADRSAHDAGEGHGASEIVLGLRGTEVGRLRLDSGVHTANAACAVAAAAAYGAPLESLSARLSSLKGSAHRSAVQRAPNGLVVIDDTFNANPVGAAAAVDKLAYNVRGRRAVVTPGMVELGSQQRQANAELAAKVVDSGATLVVVGAINRTALLEGAAGEAVTVRNRGEARDWVRANLGDEDGVLWENDLPDHYP